MYDDEMYDDEEDIGAVAPKRKKVFVGARAKRIAEINRQKLALKREATDIARRNKELVGTKNMGRIWSDPLTGKVYKIRPKTLTISDFTATANTASTTTTVLKLTSAVPNGIEYMFAPIGQKANEVYTVPQLYGTLQDSSSACVTGTTVVRILSPSGVEKERIWTGDAYRLTMAGAQKGLDIQKKLTFNVDTAVRAASGDSIDVTLYSSSTVCTTKTDFVIDCWELEAQN